MLRALILPLVFTLSLSFGTSALASRRACHKSLIRYARYFATRSNPAALERWTQRMGRRHQLLWDAERAKAKAQNRQPDFRNVHPHSPLIQALLLSPEAVEGWNLQEPWVDDDLADWLYFDFVEGSGLDYLVPEDIEPVTLGCLERRYASPFLEEFLSDPHVLTMPPTKAVRSQVIEALQMDLEGWVHLPKPEGEPGENFKKLMEADNFDLAALRASHNPQLFREIVAFPATEESRYLLLALWGDKETLNLLENLQILLKSTMRNARRERTQSEWGEALSYTQESISVLQHRLQNKPLVHPTGSDRWQIFPANADVAALIRQHR